MRVINKKEFRDILVSEMKVGMWMRRVLRGYEILKLLVISTNYRVKAIL